MLLTYLFTHLYCVKRTRHTCAEVVNLSRIYITLYVISHVGRVNHLDCCTPSLLIPHYHNYLINIRHPRTTVFFCGSFFVFMLIFTRGSSYCFQRVLAIVILSVCLSVCPSVKLVDESKAVQARITKFSPSAAWKTLVSGAVQLFHKFEGGHPEQGH